jgi:hypothetical protein
VPVKSALDLQTAIEALYNNSLLRREMGAAGRIWAMKFEQKSLWEKIILHRMETLKDHGDNKGK